MDPISLATATSALTVLGTEVAKGAASAAGKSAWEKVKGLLHWSTEPGPPDLAHALASALHTKPELLPQVLEILSDQGIGTPHALVGSIHAEKVVVADRLDVSGDFNM